MSTIPLSVCLEEGARSRRHCIPYFSYQRPLSCCCNLSIHSEVENRSCSSSQVRDVDSLEENNENHDAERINSNTCFFHYLLSGETRLPNHPLLIGKASPPEDYDTYVGEEELRRRKDKDKEENEESKDYPVSHFPSFSEAVDWITNTLEFLSSLEADSYTFTPDFSHQPGGPPPPRSGRVEFSASTGISIPSYEHAGVYQVVLAGKYTIIDDCPWAVSLRSSKLDSTRDVMMVMLSSTKFSSDLQRQRKEIKEGKATLIEFSLIRAMGNGGADEWRVFIPYLIMPAPFSSHSANHSEEERKLKPYLIPFCYSPEIVPASSSSTSNSTSSFVLVPCLSYSAVTQRCTDVCYPDFQKWNEKNHHEHHQLLVQRVMKANLLGRWQQRHQRVEKETSSFLWSSHEEGGYDLQGTHTTPTPMEAALHECMEVIYQKKCALTASNEECDDSSPILPQDPSAPGVTERKIPVYEDGSRVQIAEEWQAPTDIPLEASLLSHCPSSSKLLLQDMMLVLGVDVLWSSATLPVYVLSGKFHLFLRHNGKNVDRKMKNPNLEVDELKTKKKKGNANETHNFAHNAIPWIWTSTQDEIRPKIDKGMEKDEGMDDYEGIETVEQDGLEVNKNSIQSQVDLSTLPESESSSFWRLLRSTSHWNQYLQNVQAAREKSFSEIPNEQVGPQDEKGNDHKTKHFSSFCVLATEGDDLFAEKKDECRSGLPLEFLHPELLANNPEFAAVFQKWKDQQVKEEERKKFPLP